MQANLLFPGRPNYSGPTKGFFALLHHEQLCETSHDVMERVAYVKEHKPAHEVAIRLWNMIVLPDVFETKWNPLYDDYAAKLKLLNDDYRAKWKLLDKEIFAYVKQHISNCAWDGKQLKFNRSQ